ncbi:MAG: LTA synthase family protein, partial [Rothia sp. (in: high G+C Gram-positive bacteria)]|uniref:LTA synthase family protein n=1 Tax=Rothia sp. (in: high G+C Gram-positive bacteria) TaxID=1885016 RepID=UPI0026DFBFB2
TLLHYVLPRQKEETRFQICWTGVWLLAAGLIFLGIRGGVGRSTANVGMVYYSQRQFLNHAAVNPAFSLVSSSFKTRKYSQSFDFYPEAERARRFSTLHFNTRSVNSDTLLTTRRPNILLILMEGCGGTMVHAVDSLSDARITPNLNRLAEEGVVFTHCYANSFRTDRGTLTTLSGWPAYPDLSVMKVPSLTQKMPSIARTLRSAGYSARFLYGGDINFTNTHGYLLATGYEQALGDTYFPHTVRRTHAWGVTDHIVLDTLYHQVLRQPADRPWHIGCLTLSSHEPWKVPYHRIQGDERANAMAYLDDCIGHFIARLKQSPAWRNTLVILLPDHGINYPVGIEESNPRRSHIPIIWTGGAVKGHKVIDRLCNQSDLAATLLGQLGLDHSYFPLSRDVLSRSYTHPSAAHT